MSGLRQTLSLIAVSVLFSFWAIWNREMLNKSLGAVCIAVWIFSSSFQLFVIIMLQINSGWTRILYPSPLFSAATLAVLAASQPAGPHPVNGAPVSKLKSLHSSIPPLLLLLIDAGHVLIPSAICVPCCGTDTHTHTHNICVFGLPWRPEHGVGGHAAGDTPLFPECAQSACRQSHMLSLCLGVLHWTFTLPLLPSFLGFGWRGAAAAELSSDSWWIM